MIVSLTGCSANPSISNLTFVKVLQNPGWTHDLKGAYCKARQFTSAIPTFQIIFFGSSQYVNHDLLLATGITLCVFCLVDFSLSRRKSMLFLGYFFGAAAFLTKGLIGILIPGMILLPWLIYTQQFKRIPAFFNPMALIFLGVLIGPWLYSMQHQYPNFLHYS